MWSEQCRSQRSNHLSSVQRALAVLILLKDRQSLRVSDVSQELGVGKSTAYRLLATLEDSGFVRRDRTGHRYKLGRIVFDLGLSAVGDLDVRRRARRPIEELSEKTGETVQLLMLEGGNVRVIDGVEGSQVLHVRSRVGRLIPANIAAGGKVLLSELSPAEVRSLYPDGLPTSNGDRSHDWTRFETELARIRKLGFATNFSESEEGLHAAATAVHDRLRRPIAAVAITGPNGRISPERIRHVPRNSAMPPSRWRRR